MALMRTHRLAHLAIGIGTLGLAVSVSAQSVPVLDTQLVLAPYCTEARREDCPAFAVLDAETLRTDLLDTGDILDIEILVRSPHPERIRTVRTWLEYDPTIVSVRNIELLPALTQPIPGEQDADPTRGIVSIGGATDTGFAEQETSVARVTFQVISTRKTAVIAFHNFREDGTGETTVLDAQMSPLLDVEPSALQLEMRELDTPQQVPDDFFPTDPVPTDGSQMFSVVQVQQVRVTSQESNLFIGWDSLVATGVQGYNVYYGTISGQYIQRRSVGREENSLIIRNLEPGMQYFVAVRAFNAQNEETAFSQEQSVVIGRPETSTSPLVPGRIDDSVDRHLPDTHAGRDVAGETGIHETLLVLIAAAAVIGTLFAWRKHLTFPMPPHAG